MDSFQFTCGRVLENVDVDYFTYGTPKYDDEGYITNAILFFSTFSDNFSFLSGSHEYIIKNSSFEGDEFYFIVAHSLGAPGSCSPSTTGLKYDFPTYTCLDLVNFKRQFLSEKFKIKKILGLIGEGIGGFEVLTWACEYPEEMEFIFVTNSSAKLAGYKYILSKAFESIIGLSDDFYSDEYNVSLSRILVSINTLVFAHSANKETFHNMNLYEIDAVMDEFIDDGLFIDIHDFKFRNDCNMAYDVEDKLGNIKAKSLFVGTNDNYFNFELDMLPLKDSVNDSIVMKQDYVKKEYYFSEEDYAPIGKNVLQFLEQFKK